MIFHLYRALWWLLLPIITLFRYYKDWRSPVKYRPGMGRFRDRIGFGPLKRADIHLHAVSLGEVRAITPLVEALLKHFPQQRLLLTTTTLTGSEQVVKSFTGRVDHQYLPFDNGWMMRRFFRYVAPKVSIILETELWPNYLYQANQLQIPLFLVSGTLSESSYRGYQKIAKTMTKLLEPLHLLAQSEKDSARFVALGVKEHEVMGNIKYELTIPPHHYKEGARLLTRLEGSDHFYWVVASTHEGEEALILSSYRRVKAQYPNLQLILAPRHPERFLEVEELIKQEGLSYQKRSQTSLDELQTTVDIWLVDTLGELLTFYQVAHFVTIGGSFIPIGGHNILEPAYFGKPISVGPHMEENREIVDHFLSREALIMGSIEEVEEALKQLLKNPQLGSAMGASAAQLMAESRGGIAQVIAALTPVIEQREELLEDN